MFIFSRTQRESDRRQRLLDSLKERSNQIQKMIENPNSDRRDLFGARAYQSNEIIRENSVGWNDVDSDQPSSSNQQENTPAQSVSELRQAQQILIQGNFFIGFFYKF